MLNNLKVEDLEIVDLFSQQFEHKLVSFIWCIWHGPSIWFSCYLIYAMLRISLILNKK